jgi:hypothetical protein
MADVRIYKAPVLIFQKCIFNLRMKTQLFVCLLLIGVISACHQNNSAKTYNSKKIMPVVKSSPYMLSQVVAHEFSDPVKKDTFKLFLKGKSILNGDVHFEIVSYNHQTIYSQKFSGSDILGDLIDMDWGKKQKEDTIKARFKDFFNKQNFLKPALNIKESRDSDYVDKVDFKDIYGDNTATGFIYAYGYETTLEIAWSKKRKKVVVCFGSD